jgi:hypothetical protein
MGAAPSFLLFLNPGVNANVTLMSNVVQDFTMMAHSIVIKVDDLFTRKNRALSAVSNPFFKGARPKGTVAAVKSYYI